MPLEWFKPRGYRHLDLPVNEAFARKVMEPNFVTKHSFLPLIHYSKIEKRYKKDPETGARSIDEKSRPIKYASHRDACILAYYAYLLNQVLELNYRTSGLSDSVIAYRALGQGNYDFSAEVFAFAKSKAPVTILAFDVTGFFDNLDHLLLKQRLKAALGVASLSDDWLKVLRTITAFHYVDLEELKAHPTFAPRLALRSKERIASVEEIKAAGIKFHANPEIAKGNKRGIPQGTPISAAVSNLYMMDFDKAAQTYCEGIGALYRRYSDDIIVVCDPSQAATVEAEIMRLIAAERLEIAPHKTERTEFADTGYVPRLSRAAQYLGFTLYEDGPAIRASSLSRQWRKMRRAMKRVRRVAVAKIAAGLSDKAHTKRLYRRFSHLKVRDAEGVRTIRNFSSYGRRSAAAFGGDEKITDQVKRFEKAALKELAMLKAIGKPETP